MTSTSSTPLPPAFTLPDEIWLEILLDKKLEYGDLKRFSRTCKRFQELEQDTSLDSRLFRRSPASGGEQLQKGQTVAYHPVLDRMNLAVTKMERARIFVGRPDTQKGFEAIPAASFPVVNSYATSPATRVLEIQMADGIHIDNVSGVTVLNVVQACVNKWSSPPPLWLAEDTAETMMGWYEMSVGDVCWLDTLFDHRFYEGMREAVVVHEGVVELTPLSFGS